MKSRRKTRLPSNWRSRIEIIRHDDPPVSMGRGRFCFDGVVTFKLSFKKGRTPKGFQKHIGELIISDELPYFVDGAEIDEYFVRRGLGTLLYLHALDRLGSLATYYHSSSDAAKALWRLLVRKFPNHHKVDFFAGTLTIFKSSGTGN